MKLKVIGGTLDIEIDQLSLINDIQNALKKAAEENDEVEKRNIRESGAASTPKNKLLGSLNKKSKLPI